MNGLAIPIEVSDERFQELAGELVGFIDVMTILGELAKQRTITMFQTQGKWANVRFIPLQHWEKTFQLPANKEKKRSQDLIIEIATNLQGGKNE